jgi:hypothetical protein
MEVKGTMCLFPRPVFSEAAQKVKDFTLAHRQKHSLKWGSVRLLQPRAPYAALVPLEIERDGRRDKPFNPQRATVPHPISKADKTMMASRRTFCASKTLRHSGMSLVFKTTFEVFTRAGPDNSLERLTERSVGLVADRPGNVYELLVTLFE